MKKTNMPAVLGICFAFGSPLVICLGLLVQLVPVLSNEYRIPTILGLVAGITLSMLGFYFSFKRNDSTNEKLSSREVRN